MKPPAEASKNVSVTSVSPATAHPDGPGLSTSIRSSDRWAALIETTGPHQSPQLSVAPAPATGRRSRQPRPNSVPIKVRLCERFRSDPIGDGTCEPVMTLGCYASLRQTRQTVETCARRGETLSRVSPAALPNRLHRPPRHAHGAH
ncbi:hypothetical protein VDGL01_11212 [Verticillium dahliae]